MKAQLDAFPDYSENPTDIAEAGDKVHFLAHVAGAQQHTLALPGVRPVAPTGRSIRLPPEPAWVQVREGKLLLYHIEPVDGGGVEGF
jgi:hypothetical protein